ncbi:MAG: (d)CMP kinase, partial [Lentisphaeria bacterium]|nr:(d)CMP kinase [Lentisphaeria bacterium]
MSDNFFQVAIDGPAASGKSTVARLRAGRIGGYYVNTGDMYGTLAWQALEKG